MIPPQALLSNEFEITDFESMRAGEFKRYVTPLYWWSSAHPKYAGEWEYVSVRGAPDWALIPVCRLRQIAKLYKGAAASVRPPYHADPHFGPRACLYVRHRHEHGRGRACFGLFDVCMIEARKAQRAWWPSTEPDPETLAALAVD